LHLADQGFITWSLAKNPQILDRTLAHGPAAIMLSFGDPRPFAAAIHAAGALADSVTMTFKNRLTRILDIEHPILLAPMDLVSGGRVAAAVSQAGGLGLLGGGYDDADWIDREWDRAGNARLFRAVFYPPYLLWLQGRLNSLESLFSADE